jgi:O-antigen ligase
LPTLLFAAVLVANGMGSDAWSIGDLLFGLVEASVFFILFYLVYFGALEDDTDGLIDYVIFCSALTVLVLAADMVYFFAVTPDLFNADGAIMKEKLELGFGISNSLGFCASVFLPVCVFGVNRARGILRKVFYFVATAISLVLVVVSLCRNALLFSGIALVLAFIICSFFGEGRRACRVIVFLGTVICGALLFVYWDDVIRITTEYINRSTLDSGRFKLWGYALDKFDVSHLLGEGFLAIQDYEDIVDTFRFVPIMAHNTPLQMLVSCGIVGLLLYCIYRVATLWPLIKRPSFVKIMLASPVLMTICESLLDNFIFYIYMAFPYVVFLAIIHKIGEEEKSRDLKI